MKVTIAGGWGYNNLGDEAILAGYIEYLRSRDAHVSVVSVDPSRTANAQLLATGMRKESVLRGVGAQDKLLIGGGGYLNGSWFPEIYFKLARLVRTSAGRGTTVHGIELRGMNNRVLAGLARTLLTGADVAVRDVESSAQMAALGLPAPELMPDGISLLTGHLDRYRRDIPALKNRVVLNLLDVGARNDSSEAQVDLSSWRAYCTDLLAQLGDRAVGLVIGGGDYRFMKSLGALPLLFPTSVVELVSILGSAESVFSVRMHPALIATALGKPTVSVPYCGKVQPTLERIGVDQVILKNLDSSDTLESLDTSFDHGARWTEAARINEAWLDQAIFC